ncbi:PREDICTED: uncharacterized protein LOC18595169 isoform X1 [Theobroma cacao]|uniref:Uncharacterized protein LOC18595169 isoform X1 n=1 Tax=Theobroma cacao TaxID=3641 RepID=A0AB32WN69_THECC|nr:PREDICTED: uncharacterized protein LOC18595169 isoform X1 [Theobroma cacao]
MCQRQAVIMFAERDFLWTEGDPGAAGYTIKEAVTPTRSTLFSWYEHIFLNLGYILSGSPIIYQANNIPSYRLATLDTISHLSRFPSIAGTLNLVGEPFQHLRRCGNTKFHILGEIWPQER